MGNLSNIKRPKSSKKDTGKPANEMTQVSEAVTPKTNGLPDIDLKKFLGCGG
jgi:hypothetical protein